MPSKVLDDVDFFRKPLPRPTRSIKGMECLIPVINKLRDVFDRTGGGSSAIELPQIVVLGSQSSGKSSVLESLVGKPFLPRGTGIVTRCPIVLNLVNIDDDEEWVEFHHKQNVKFKIEEVEKEIRAQTCLIAGVNMGITMEKIQLTVYSPNVLTLTVVDLPGLVKIATHDQPEDIEQQVECLVMEFITQPNSVILAVSPGNADIATSDSIKLAKTVDPLQERTIAVITKLDLAVDDLSDVLSGRTLPMKLGIIGVINRSQKDLDNRVTYEEALAKEKGFLKQWYPGIAKVHGTPFLALKLNNVLMKHIQKCCPSLDMKVKQLLSEKRESLEELGGRAEMSDEEKSRAMSTILDKFSKTYKAEVDGQGRTEIVTGRLTGGARIDYICQNMLMRNLELLKPLEALLDEEIIIAVRNSVGLGMRLFQPEVALHHLIKREVAKMKPVALHVARLVHEEMIEMIDSCVDKSHRFPSVNRAISQVVKDLVTRRMDVTKEILGNYIDVQASSGLTYDPEYHNQLETLTKELTMVDLGTLPAGLVLHHGHNDPILGLSNGQAMPMDYSSTLSFLQKRICLIVRTLLQKYFLIITKQVQDHVPKSLQHSLIYHTVDSLHIELSTKLCTSEKIDELIREPESIATLRENLLAEIESLTEASELLDEVRASSLCGE